MPLRIYVARHGETAWNRERRLQGHADIPLSPTGIEQARRLAARLAASGAPPGAVWTSDLCRAAQTAKAIADACGAPLMQTSDLRETCLGEWEGLTEEEIIGRGDGELLQRYYRDSHRYRPPGAETFESAWTRVLTAAAGIRNACPHGSVAVVGHGGSLRALLCDALGAPVPSMRRMQLSNASLSVIEEHPDLGSRVVLLNDTSHLA